MKEKIDMLTDLLGRRKNRRKLDLESKILIISILYGLVMIGIMSFIISIL